MKKSLFLAMLILATPAHALELNIRGIESNKPIDEKFAFCKPDGKGKTENGGNINPEMNWKNIPAGTKSLALILVDKDVPASFDDANKEGKTLPKDMKRQDFYHWVLVDIPTHVTRIDEEGDSSGHQEGGKPLGKRAHGVVGQNDYASFMKGTFGGYDGPCPPWNDERIHHYHFQLYALNVPTLGLSSAFTGKQAMKKITKHTLAKAEIVGTFSNKP